MSTIVQLTAENVKAIKAVRIKPTPKGIVVIGGENGAGKTSVLDSIQMALEGKKAAPPKPVRVGRKRAEIILELEDMKIRRTINANGRGAVTITGKDGTKHSSPQALLDKLVHNLSFDPLAFSRMKPEAQGMELRRLTGLDFTDLDTKRGELYAKRTVVNREAKRLTTVVDEMPTHDVPDDEVSLADLMAEQMAARDKNEANANENARQANRVTDARAGLASAEEDVTGSQNTIRVAEKAIAERQETMARVKTELIDMEAHLQGAGKKLLTYQDDVSKAEASVEAARRAIKPLIDVDEAPIMARMASAEETNRKVRENQAKLKASQEAATTRATVDGLSRDIERLDETKEERLAAVDFPVDGLGFDEQGVTIKIDSDASVPFSQASEAEKLRVSVAMGLAMNPDLKVLLIRDASLLDAKNLALIAMMAEKADAQVWLERVGDGEEVSVVIVDGEVAEDRTGGAVDVPEVDHSENDE